MRMSIAERAEQLKAGAAQPRCPFCGSRETSGVTDGFPAQTTTGFWECANCGESGEFDATALHWAATQEER